MSPSSVCPSTPGVSYRPGARFGGNAIREASRLLRPYNPAQDASPFALAQVADAGDIAANPFNINEAVETIEAAADDLLGTGARLMTLGGDHTIALPLLRSVAKKHGPVALLHFDAHLDTWDTYFGAEYTHGTPFRRAVEEGILDTEALSHVGTRGPLYGKQDLTDDEKMGFGIVTSADVYRRGADEVADQLRQRIGDRPLYISIDIDVLDPAHAPGTGTPEAGGITSRELLEILRGLASCNLVSADVVEVAPAYDHAEITSVAASHTAYELTTIMSRQIAAARRDGPSDPRPRPGTPADAAQTAAALNPPAGRNGGDLVVETLTGLGATTVFGLPGQHALGMFDALRRSDLAYIGLRVENNAGFAADAYGRITGEAAPLLLSTGPGALTSLAALQEAAAASRARAGDRQPDPDRRVSAAAATAICTNCATRRRRSATS